jgi:ankyrin repeat protein
VVQLLLSAGAAVEAADNEGWRSLHWASQNSHDQVVQLLLQAGATAEVHDSNGEVLWLHQPLCSTHNAAWCFTSH